MSWIFAEAEQALAPARYWGLVTGGPPGLPVYIDRGEPFAQERLRILESISVFAGYNSLLARSRRRLLARLNSQSSVRLESNNLCSFLFAVISAFRRQANDWRIEIGVLLDGLPSNLVFSGDAAIALAALFVHRRIRPGLYWRRRFRLSFDVTVARAGKWWYATVPVLGHYSIFQNAQVHGLGRSPEQARNNAAAYLTGIINASAKHAWPIPYEKPRSDSVIECYATELIPKQGAWST